MRALIICTAVISGKVRIIVQDKAKPNCAPVWL